ncbi:MAG TPA: tRNA epoxyqueuosine(34) reductase QueG [Vicinamibacteria bacterium]|nr:tRNA epoxyqueuosine(34) reductase QueG [Vicinamibacteria bacterium]
MTPDDLREAIASKARAVGFDKVGFAPARLPASDSDALKTWLARGYQGDMEWMARAAERRTDASRSLEGALTLVCCGLNYYRGAPVSAPPGSGVISSYAQGEDYHLVLGEKLKEVAAFIEARASVPTRIYVDTGPLLEKSYAAAAGLGWVGKHSNLLLRLGSSWFFLGEILVPMALEPSAAERNHCGTCTRCIAACPTGAIVAPYVVDSNLCISYLTIELRGFVPRELRPLIGNRIYGCDDCQDVCPWNRFAAKSDVPAFLPKEPLASMDLEAILRMSRQEFLEATRGSAIRRARYAGFLRNAAIALGNAREPRSVPALVEALAHEEALVRGHAAWALGVIGDFRASVPLSSRLGQESDARVKDEIEWALAELSRSARPRRPRASS